MQLHLQSSRALLKTARFCPPPVCNLQLHQQSPHALLPETALLASPRQPKLYPLPTSRPPPAPLNLEQCLQRPFQAQKPHPRHLHHLQYPIPSLPYLILAFLGVLAITIGSSRAMTDCALVGKTLTISQLASKTSFVRIWLSATTMLSVVPAQYVQ
jgi:hypothetical protein